MTDLADLDDDELLHLWIASKQRHAVTDWLAEFQARRIGRRPAGPITAYRGAHEAEGMSWTTDLPTARSFARKNHAPLWRTELRPRAVLAVIETTGGWDEYVVDPARLGRVHEVDERPNRTGRRRRFDDDGRPAIARHLERQREADRKAERRKALRKAAEDHYGRPRRRRYR